MAKELIKAALKKTAEKSHLELCQAGYVRKKMRQYCRHLHLRSGLPAGYIRIFLPACLDFGSGWRSEINFDCCIRQFCAYFLLSQRYGFWILQFFSRMV